MLRELAEEKPEEYATFWKEMGVFLKQGVACGVRRTRQELLPPAALPRRRALRGKPISLAEYVGRMIEGQSEIYYLLGSDPVSVATSPHLDPFKARGIEVLLLSDPFDGFMMQGAARVRGQEVPQRGRSRAGRCRARRRTRPEQAEPLPEADWAEVVARFKMVLGDRVTEVRESQLLTDSPARLVSPDAGFERDMQRVRRLIEQDYKTPPKILELNRRHPLMRNLAGRIAAAARPRP